MKEVQSTNIKGVKAAVTSGLAVAAAAQSSKRKPEEQEGGKKKTLKVWGMDDLGSDSDDSDSDGEDDGPVVAAVDAKEEDPASD